MEATRIVKISVSICFLFVKIPLLTSILVLISSDSRTVKNDVSILI